MKRNFELAGLGRFAGWDNGKRHGGGHASPLFDRLVCEQIAKKLAACYGVTFAGFAEESDSLFLVTLDLPESEGGHQEHGFPAVSSRVGRLWPIGAGVWEWSAVGGSVHATPKRPERRARPRPRLRLVNKGK